MSKIVSNLRVHLKVFCFLQQKDACSLCGSLKFQKMSAALIVHVNFSYKIIFTKSENGFIEKTIACFWKGKTPKHCIDIRLLLQCFKLKGCVRYIFASLLFKFKREHL